VCALSACGAQGNDYANVRWGMTVDETREALQKSGRVILSEAEGDYGKIFHIYDGEEYLINATQEFTETYIFKKASDGLALCRIVVKAEGIPLKDALPKLSGQLGKPEIIPAAKNIINERLNQWPDSLKLTKGNGIETSRTAGIFAYSEDTVLMQLIPSEENVSVAAYDSVWWGMDMTDVWNTLQATGRVAVNSGHVEFPVWLENKGDIQDITAGHSPESGLDVQEFYYFRKTADNAHVLFCIILSAEIDSRERLLKRVTAQYGSLIPDARNIKSNVLLEIADFYTTRESGIQSGRTAGIVHATDHGHGIGITLIPARENVAAKLTEGIEFDYANIFWEMNREQTEAALKARGHTVRRKGDVLEVTRDFRDIVLQEKFNFDKNGRFTSINIEAEDNAWTILTNALAKTYSRHPLRSRNNTRTGQRSWEYTSERLTLKASETGGGDVSITITPDGALAKEIQAGNRFVNKSGKVYARITVRTAQEFVNALGSDRTILLEPGVYNLSSVRQDYTNNVYWSEVFDGNELNLFQIENLTIQGSEKGQSSIVVDPRYAFVLVFEHSSNISISNIYAGHTDSGYCHGGVFSFRFCAGVKIENTHMYGCGTVGLDIQSVTDMSVKNSTIYECTYQIMAVRDSRNIRFENCVFRNNAGFDLVELNGVSNFVIDKSEFRENVHSWKGYSFFTVQSSQNVLIKNTQFTGNSPITRQGLIILENCTFTDNDRSHAEGEG